MNQAVNNGFESCVLLINPTRYPQYIRILKRLLKKTVIPVIIESKSKSHFLEMVHEFYNGPYRYLLVWGGNGTAHDAINAMMNAANQGNPDKEKAIGFLRGGSGNGIQDSYEVPYSIGKQLSVYAESMKHDYTIKVDLLKIRQNRQVFFGQLVGLGFDTGVLKLRDAQKALRDGNIKSGLLNYAHSTVVAFLKNDLKTEQYYNLNIHNGKYALRGTRINAEFPIKSLRLRVNPPLIEVGTRPYYGRLFKICPDVVCNDGNMDLYLFNFETKTAIARHIISLWNGWHHKINKRFARKDKPLIQRFEIKRLEIEAGEQFDFHIDGELKTNDTPENGLYSLTIEVVPQTIYRSPDVL